jgi:hypothetical protein
LALENPAHDYVLASKKNPPFFFAENNLKWILPEVFP